MGFLNNVMGFGGLAQSLGGAIKDTSEVFHVNETEKMYAQEKRFQTALSQFEGEFVKQNNWFDSLIGGLNRLPRPTMAIGTISLFVYAMMDPQSFSDRMVGLNHIPDQLWWLLGAIVGFYFGARELHHHRAQPVRKFRERKSHKSVHKTAENFQERNDTDLDMNSIENQTGIDMSKIAQTSKTRDNAAILEWIEKQA